VIAMVRESARRFQRPRERSKMCDSGQVRQRLAELPVPTAKRVVGPDVMDDLVPDVARRASLVADTPRVPPSFYDDPVQLPRVRVGRNGTAFDFIWNRPLGMNADRHAGIAGMRLLGRRSTGSRRLAGLRLLTGSGSPSLHE